MISKKSKNSDVCEEIKRFIIEQQDEELIGDQDKLIYDHLDACQNCSNYYQTILKMEESFIYNELDLQPDPMIRRNLVSRLRKKKIERETGLKRYFDKLFGVFEYRIPVYQAVFAFFILFALVFTIDQVSISQRPAGLDGTTYFYMDQTILINSQSVDNIKLIEEYKCGRNVKEDSILTRYLVSAM